MQFRALTVERVPSRLRHFGKRSFRACITDAIDMHGQTWSGGSRSSYQWIDLGSGASWSPEKKATPKQGDPFGWIPDIERESCELPPGIGVVETGYFCGKDMGATFHVREDDYVRTFGPDPEAPELSDVERECLGALSLKSGPYRKEALARAGWADDVRDRMVQLGLIKVNRAGAVQLTPEGRNVSRGVRS